MTVPLWAWAAFAAFVVAMLVLDLFVLHRRAREVSLREAGAWSAVWIAAGLGFGGLVWAWAGGGAAQAYLAGYLIEKSLSVDNIFLFAAIFSAFAIPARYQHRVLMFGIIGALVMRAAFIAAGITLLEADPPGHLRVRRGACSSPRSTCCAAAPRMPRRRTRACCGCCGGCCRSPTGCTASGSCCATAAACCATPLLLALVVVEFTDVIFAVDSIPAVLAVTTDPFVVYTSNVFALLGMRALYFLLAGAAARLRYLRPGLAVILAGGRGQAAARRRLGVPRVVGAGVHHAGAHGGGGGVRARRAPRAALPDSARKSRV